MAGVDEDKRKHLDRLLVHMECQRKLMRRKAARAIAIASVGAASPAHHESGYLHLELADSR